MGSVTLLKNAEASQLVGIALHWLDNFKTYQYMFNALFIYFIPTFILQLLYWHLFG